VVKLALPKTWKNHPVFHVSLIKPVSKDPIAHPVEQPPLLSKYKEKKNGRLKKSSNHKCSENNYNISFVGKDSQLKKILGYTHLIFTQNHSSMHSIKNTHLPLAKFWLSTGICYLSRK
jgi:hypothetical protein